jgi:hypothetical protein
VKSNWVIAKRPNLKFNTKLTQLQGLSLLTSFENVTVNDVQFKASSDFSKVSSQQRWLFDVDIKIVEDFDYKTF